MYKLAFIVLMIFVTCFAQATTANDTEQDPNINQAQDVQDVQVQKVSGFYLGGTIGSAKLKQTRASSVDSASAMSFQLLAGYQFNRVVGVELAYTDFGKLEYNDLLLAFIPTESEPTAFTGQVNLGYTFGNGIRPFGLIGLSHLQLNQTNSLYDDDSHFTLHSGLGLEYAPVALQGIAFTAMWNADWFIVEYPALDPQDIPAPHTDLVSLRNLSIGAHYKF